jgi:hypothetical protein
LAKDVKPAQNILEVQLLVHTAVMDSLRVAARKVARLGILDSDDAAVVFKELVDEYIILLKHAGPRANYFPIPLDKDKYRAFYEQDLETIKRKYAEAGVADPMAMD